MLEFFYSLSFLVDNYWGVFLLMTIESSFVPFPSEVIVPPAAYLAFQGYMNVYLVVVAGLAGSVTGALINYFLAMKLGRPLVYILIEKKWMKYLLLNRRKLEKSEEYFRDYGALSTFIGRLIPAVRQLISLPAGFSRMNLGVFVFFTSLGAGIWVSILAALGYFFGAEQERLIMYYREITFSFIVLAIVVFLFLYIRWRRRKRFLQIFR